MKKTFFFSIYKTGKKVNAKSTQYVAKITNSRVKLPGDYESNPENKHQYVVYKRQNPTRRS